MLFSYQIAGIRLQSRTYANNSIVNITDIAETASLALYCITTYPLCCTSANPETQWYFPNGSAVPDSFESGIHVGNLPYSRSRSTSGTVRLNRNRQGTTTGIFHCNIPDVNNIPQSLYVGIYTSTTGEFCCYAELVGDDNLMICNTNLSWSPCTLTVFLIQQS